MFSNEEEATKEARCFDDSMALATQCIVRHKYGYAATHLEDAARSLKELQRMKEEKQNGQVRLVGYVLGSRNDVDRRI